MDCWYFAYGSNLLHAQMVARVGPLDFEEKPPRIGRLNCYQVAFNMLGEDGQYYANLVQPGDGVLGVLYLLDEEAISALDRYECGYVRQAVEVVDQHNISVLAATYIAAPEHCTEPGTPEAAYLQRILDGARAHGLPEVYMQTLEAAGKA